MDPFATVKEYLLLFTILFIAGLLATSRVVLVVAFVPLFICLIGISLSSPRVEARRTWSKDSARIGETIDIQASGAITGGIGTIIFREELPEPFELVEGSNYRVMWKGFGKKEFAFSYRAKCTKRGHYYFRGVEWESSSLLGLEQPAAGIIGPPNELLVSPHLFDFRKVRIPYKVSFMSTPMQGITKFGVMSTDFREIRQYTPGDPFKLINWKATARMSTRTRNFPLVNEYEREGKLCAWIFLDAHQNMRFGTSIESAFEHSIEAAINLARFFLDKGFLLGLYVYNGMKESFYPDVGKQQFTKIANGLLELYSVERGLKFYTVESLPEAIEINRELMTSYSPLVVVITHLTQNNTREVTRGIKEISAHARRKHWGNMLVINVLPYDLIPKKDLLETLAAQTLEAKSKRLSEQLRRLGVVVLDWNPVKENFGSLLIKHLRLLLSR